MVKNYQILPVIFFLISSAANAGDTIFTSAPNARNWNTEYMQQVFFEDFNGTRLNQEIWTVDYCKSRGYSGNNEGEPNNIKVSNGSLKLIVQYSPANKDTNCWENTNFVSDYTTAEITTQKHRFKYGSFEAKCLMPRGDHFYYAYWLWGPGGEGYPRDGYASEIDIAEGTEWSDGTHHEMKTSVHYWSHTNGEIKLPPDWTFGYDSKYEGEWHIYKLIWNPFEINYFVDDTLIWTRSKHYKFFDRKMNDVEMNEIVANSVYKARDYFPNHEMQTTFQMHIQKGVLPEEIPVSMEVEYVKVKQYFLSPEIICPKIIYSEGSAKLDVDSLATNISWSLSPTEWFTNNSGIGKNAYIKSLPDKQGETTLTYTFTMPSGEIFSAKHNFLLKQGTSANRGISSSNNSQADLNIIPNPANNETTISIGEKSNPQTEWNLEIYNAGGQLKFKKYNLLGSQYKINLSGWAIGVYLVRVNGPDGGLAGKLIVKE